LTDIAFVPEEFADEIFRQFWHWRRITDVSGCELEGDNLALVIEDEMQFETKEPSRSSRLVAMPSGL